MLAKILKFPDSVAQMKVIREQMRAECPEQDGEPGEPETLDDDELTRYRRFFARLAILLVKELKPVLWNWVGLTLTLTFRVRPEILSALAADVEKAKLTFSAIHAVSGEFWWIIDKVEEVTFDRAMNLVVVKCGVLDCLSSDETEEIDDRWDFLIGGVNDADFRWEYAFRMR